MRYIIAFFLLTSCAPSSWDDLRAEGEAETRKLAHLLHDIDTKDELSKQLPAIRKSYLRLAELIQAVRKMEEKTTMPELSEPSEASDALFAELARLYEMPGCREMIEEAQVEAIRRLTN